MCLFSFDTIKNHTRLLKNITYERMPNSNLSFTVDLCKYVFHISCDCIKQTNSYKYKSIIHTYMNYLILPKSAVGNFIL